LLEVGCGAGALLVDLSLMGFNCTGLETSARAVEMAAALSAGSDTNHEIVSTPGEGWQSRYGLVCAFDVLEHIEDDVDELARWFSWIRPGGHLLISVPAHSSRWGVGDVWAGHYRRYDREPLLKMLSEQGLRIDHVECYGFPLANFTEWVGQRAYRKLMIGRDEALCKEIASAESGVQREAYLRHFGWIHSMPGRVALRACFLAQKLALESDFGSGYLVLATRT
jgi:SAM-dependent methyltransferase